MSSSLKAVLSPFFSAVSLRIVARFSPMPSPSVALGSVPGTALCDRGSGPAARTQLARNAPCRLCDGARDAAGRPAGKYPIRVAHDADASDRVSRVVEDRSGHARLAEHGLVALAGYSGVAGRGELLAEGPGCKRPAGELCGGRLEQVVEQLGRRECEHGLSERTRVHRQLGADLEDLKGRVGPEDVVARNHRRAVHDADADRGVRPLGKSLGVDDRAPAELVEVEVGVAELQEPGAELVLVGIAVL